MTQKHETSINEIRPIVEATVAKLAMYPERFGVSNDDIVQDVMIKCYRYWDNFRGECKIESWVYGITKNILINYDVKRNRKSRKANHEYFLDHTPMDFEEEGSNTEDIFLEKERMDVVEDIIQSFSSREKREILYRSLKGDNKRQISEEMGISYQKVVTTVKEVEGLGEYYIENGESW